jgi:predicted secreted protein
VAQVCKQVTVQDSVTTPQASVDYIKIMSINPNPVITRMVTTIFSRNSNVEVEIAVYDIYGVKK